MSVERQTCQAAPGDRIGNMKALMMFLVAVGVLVGSSGPASAVEGPAWRECYDGLRCTEVPVPADWTRPAGGTQVVVPLLKIPATEEKLGVLLVNPGGPGRSIPNFALPGYRDQFADLATRFDVVVFDPRGLDVTCPS